MGNEKHEEVIGQMEDILGLGAEKEEISSEEIQDTVKSNTTTVTHEQLSINKEIAKIDLQLESLTSQPLDIEAFYNNLDTELSDEEQQLEFSDKSAYMKLVAQKAKEFETKNANSEAIVKLQEDKKELEAIYMRQSAIMEVSNKYPDYNHETIMKFYQNKLSKDEQEEIMKSATSYVDVYVNTYKKFLTLNHTNIHSAKNPNIPNLNNARRQSVNNADIEHGMTSHDAQLRQALGL